MKLLPIRSPINVSLVVAAAAFAITSSASAATQLVGDFGNGGWYSWDTRTDTGTALNGSSDTSPSINSTLLGRAVGSPSAADDTTIGKQIVFMDEGQTVNDAAGNVRPAGPTTSLGGLGYVRLDPRNSNSGKSDLSYVDTNGIAPASALITPDFDATYRYYIEAGLSFRTVGLNIALTNASLSNLYIFAYVQGDLNAPSLNPPPTIAGWNVASVTANTGEFSLFVSGMGNVGYNTLTGWANDPTYGPQIFGGSESVFRVGFNMGSGQQNGLNYIDWLQTSLLNGGDMIDFVGPSAVPEPATWLIGALAMCLLTVQVVRARAFSKRAAAASARRAIQVT
jgi:hypothetical protein